MRFLLAIICCKLLRLALRLLGRGGTALPGQVALRICPDMLSRLSRGVRVAVVTGTNGKTTTCRMLEKMLRDAGEDCFANRSGSRTYRFLKTPENLRRRNQRFPRNQSVL